MLQALQAAFRLVSGDVAFRLRQARRNAVLYTLAGVFALTAYALAVMALTIAVADELGALGATAVVCAAAVVLALLVLVVARILDIRDRRIRRSLGHDRATLAAIAAGLGPAVVRSRPLTTVMAAAGAGFFLYVLLRSRRTPRTEPAPPATPPAPARQRRKTSRRRR